MRELRTLPWVLVVVAAQFLVMLDSSILNVALPSIAADLGAADLGVSSFGAAWILNAYFLTFGGCLLVAGRAADVLGRRRMFAAGAALLAIGAVVGAAATSEWAVVVARLVQGLGAAALSPAAMSIILAGTAGMAGRVRATAMSAWGAASALAGATGVSVGGVVTATFGWRAVFVVTATLAIVVLVTGWRMLPRDAARTPRSFDAAGALAVTVAATAAVWAVLSIPAEGLGSPSVIVGAALAVVGLVVFVVRERFAADPVLPLGLLRDARVAGGVVVNALGGGARIACFFMVAILLQRVLEFAPGTAGLAMLPTSIAGFAVTALALPRLLARFGPERVVVAGLALLAAAHLLFAAGARAATAAGGAAGPDASAYWWNVLPAMLLAAAGVAMSFTPTTLVIASGVPAARSGVASGLASSSAQLGGAMGVAVFTAVDAAARTEALAAGAAAPLAAAGAGMSAAFTVAAIVAGAAATLAATWFLVRTRRAAETGVGAGFDPVLAGARAVVEGGRRVG